MRLEPAMTLAYSPLPAFYEPAGESVAPKMQSTRGWKTEDAGIMSRTSIVPAPDPKKQYEAKRAAENDSYLKLHAEMKARISELVTDALMVRDPVSEASLADFRSFMSQISFGRRPAIYLLDNGNFRAVWKNPENEQAAFQFRGNGIVHCVFFLKRKAPQLPLNSETLIDILPKVRARLGDFEHLLQG